MLSLGSARLSCELDAVVEVDGGAVVTGDSTLVSSCTLGILKFFKLASPTEKPSDGAGGGATGSIAGDFFGILGSFMLEIDDLGSVFLLLGRLGSSVDEVERCLTEIEGCRSDALKDAAFLDGGAPADKRTGSLGVEAVLEDELGFGLGILTEILRPAVGLAVVASVVGVGTGFSFFLTS